MTVHMPDIPEASRRTSVAPAGKTNVGAGLYRAVLKRVFDIIGSLALLAFATPIVLVAAIAVAMDGHNPFFVQKRVGRNGRIFSIFKLRSMVPDADALLEAHLAADSAARAEYDATQKLKHDPRITRIGRFIRRSSIDELPQLLNVLRGDMSLVGPRPMLVSQVQIYRGSAYYRLRPGITGLWQVSERNNCSFAQRVSYDTRYDANMSLLGDLRILVSTIVVVFRCTGH